MIFFCFVEDKSEYPDQRLHYIWSGFAMFAHASKQLKLFFLYVDM